MRKYFAPVAVVAIALIVFFAGIAIAQSGALAGLVQPVDITIEQVVPFVADIAIPVEGKVITTSVPLSAALSMRLQLANNPVPVAAVAAPVYELADAARLLPTLDEMPVGYYRDGEPSESLSNEDVATVFEDPDTILALLEEVGRQGGMYSSFANAQFTPFAGGNGRINATVLIFDDAAGADQYLASGMDREMLLTEKPEAVHALSGPKLGDNSILYVEDTTNEETKISEYSLWVRHGNAVLIFEAKGLRNVGNVDQVIDVANRVLSRLKS